MNSRIQLVLIFLSATLFIGQRPKSGTAAFDEAYLSALRQLGARNYEAAIFSLKKLITQNPASSFPYPKLVAAYQASARLDSAESYFRSLSLSNGLDLWALGLIELERKDAAAALVLFKRSLAKSPHCPEVYESIADAYEQLEKAEAGRAYFDAVVARDPDNAAAWYGKGTWHLRRSEWKETLEAAKKAIARDSTLYKAYYLAGWAHHRLAHFQKALAICRKGKDLALAQGDYEQHAKFLRLIGVTSGRLGDIDEALRNARRTLEAFQRIGDRLWIETALGDIGMQYYELGDYDAAERYLRRAYKVTIETNNHRHQARHLNNLGILFSNQGKFPETMEIYDRALPLYREMADKNGEGILLSNYAELYFELGMLDKAIDMQRNALRLAQDSNNSRSETVSLANLGNYLEAAGEQQEALTFFEQALQKSRAIGYKKVETACLEALGNYHARKQDLATSRSYLLQGLGIANEIQEKREAALILNDLGWHAMDTEQYRSAEDYFRKAIAQGEEVGDLNAVKTGHAGMALMFEEQQQYKKALRHYDKVIQMVEGVRGALETDAHRVSYFAKEVDIYEKVVAMLAKMHDKWPDNGYEVRALQYAERAMARSLLDMVHHERAMHSFEDLSDVRKQQLMENERALDAKHAELSVELARAELDQAVDKVALLEDEIDHLERARSKIEKEVLANRVNSVRQSLSDSLMIPTLQQELIAENQAFLKYLIAADGGHVWLLTRDNLHYAKLALNRAKLDTMLASASPILDGNGGDFGEVLDHRVANFSPKALRDLYYALFPEAIRDRIRNVEELVILPDHTLLALPFEILICDITDGKIHYLIEDHAISYAPSFSFLRQNRMRKRTPSKTLLAVGNPDFGGQQALNFVEWVSSLKLVQSVFRSASFRALPNAENEARAIGSLFEDSLVMTGDDATEAKFKENVSQYRYIHVATHFISNEKQPDFSRIVLSQTGNEGEDGFLQTYEVYNLKMNADMVVLSGCNTGRGKLRKGEGLLGITRAFQSAGVPTLIASFWPVQDESTARLMTDFYRYLKAGRRKNEALRLAKLSMLQARDKTHDPFYWGAFVLFGDPN